MEYIKTQEYHTRIDVYFDGEKYVFINAFHGLVAIARRDYNTSRFSEDNTRYFVTFHVEKASTISESTIERIINKGESTYMPCYVTYVYDTISDRESLPYFVSVNLEKRGQPKILRGDTQELLTKTKRI